MNRVSNQPASAPVYRQIALLGLESARRSGVLPATLGSVQPQRVWASLSTLSQIQVHQTLVRVVAEVLNERP